MDHCYALLERGGPQGGLLIGLYADRAHAIEVARSQAEHRLRRCRDVDRLAFGRHATSDYVLSQVEAGPVVSVGILHQPSGEADLMSWIVDTRAIHAPPPAVQDELHGLFARAGGAS